MPTLSVPFQRRLEGPLTATQPSVQRQCGTGGPLLAQCTFPDYRHSPTGQQQSLPGSAVPLHIGPEFRLPEVRPCGGVRRIGTSFMTVPEAAMHEADSSEPAEDQVRCSRELPIMKTVPETACVQCAAQRQFGFRVPAADSRHHPRPNSSINYIDHVLSCVAWKEGGREHIPPNIFEAIKEVAVTERSIAPSEPGLSGAPASDPDRGLIDRLRRHAPIWQRITCGSRLAAAPPGERLSTCRSADSLP